MTFCIHVPTLEANVPPHTTRNGRCARAARAVPRAYATSPSTSASVASSRCGSWARALNPLRCGSRSSVDQHAGVEDAGGIEGALGRAQRVGEGVRPLAVVPGPMVAAYRVVVGDVAAMSDDRVGGRGLDVGPLLELGPSPSGREDGEVGRGPVGIHVSEPAGHDAPAA